jgi:hypothetical protein
MTRIRFVNIMTGRAAEFKRRRFATRIQPGSAVV